MSSNELRQPILQVAANSALLTSVYEGEICSNAFLGADRFTFTAAIVPGELSLYSQVPLRIELSAGVDRQVVPLLTGLADRVEIDPVRNNIHVSGRDLTAQFISTQTHESFDNRTSSEVVELLAARHGLTAAASPTTALVGRYYQNSYTRTALSQHGRATTEWDLLCWLAQQEGFSVWVSGAAVYFQPLPLNIGIVSVTPADCTSMHLSRDMDIANGFSVEVRSWNCATQALVSQIVSYQSGSASPTRIVMLRPNLASNDASKLAQRVASQLSSHERLIEYELPADLTTTVRSQLELSATGTDFDGIYTICDISRRFSQRSGFTQTVQARQFPWINS